MYNLESKIGLDIQLKDNFRLEFAADVEFDEFSVRKFSDLGVVAEDENLKLSDEPAYLMYRNVRRMGDLEKIVKAHLRFDLTVIPPSRLGKEYVKTSGHYHPKKPNTNIAYPELYFVISGQATYLNQKSEVGRIEDAILSRVKEGELIITPPGYGHVTINESDEPIVMANWVCDDFKSVYGDYEEKRGACYYILANSKKLMVNNKYSDVPKEKVMNSKPKLLSEFAGKPIYDYIKNIKELEFLSNPEEYTNDLMIENIFRD